MMHDGMPYDSIQGQGQGQGNGAFELPTTSEAVRAGGDDRSPLAEPAFWLATAPAFSLSHLHLPPLLGVTAFEFC